ncbi:MAG: 2-oxoacid:acceptor oxidoreductase subunit alpha [Verrucomicrobia bacterium]|nr:2-oxoacid:acceptor oxidoreductase subunit alpha [Verrucomicrobiota bacterium]
MSQVDYAVSIGGEAGQGIATPGDVLAAVFARRGLNLNAYNAYQSIIRGGHIFLTIRTSDGPVRSHGDKLDALVALNQDTMNRHLKLMGPGSSVLFDSEKIKPGQPASGVQLCPLPVKTLQGASVNKLNQNTVAIGALVQMFGIEFKSLEDALARQFRKKGEAVIAENTGVARAGYEHAASHFKPFPTPLPDLNKSLAFLEGNAALAMGGVAAGVKFYCAYPMSPATGILMWMARHARQLGIMVRQVEDEISVINMAIGAAHAGCRTMCATSGGGFALMTEAMGAAAMMEIPVVCINVQRAGPATGVPTKTEQGDLWQALGAGQGDYPRFIVAPTSIEDCFRTMPELFNLTDQFQCPGIVLSDLLISEGRATVPPETFRWDAPIDRGELILPDNNGNGCSAGPNSGSNDFKYYRYKNTESGVSPRAAPGTPGRIHVVATDEHDEDGTLISDEFTHPAKRRMMHDKRMRKMQSAMAHIPLPRLVGPENAAVTLVGWGSTEGVISEAIEKLAAEDSIAASQLQIKWLVPFRGGEILDILSSRRKVIVVENNSSGQFARFLRAETGFQAHGWIRKYDGEPFMPHHIVNGVREILAGRTDLHVPVHEIMV